MSDDDWKPLCDALLECGVTFTTESLAAAKARMAGASPRIDAGRFEALVGLELAATFAMDRLMAVYMSRVLLLLEGKPNAGEHALQASVNPPIGMIMTLLDNATPEMKAHYVRTFKRCLDEATASRRRSRAH